MKRPSSQTAIGILAWGFLSFAPLGADVPFVHPGLLQSQEDLDRMKSAVAAKQEPIYSGFEALQADPASQLTYQMKDPFEEIGRSPGVHNAEFDKDATAAYQCAMMWCITGNKGYAEKSKAILNGWSHTLKRCTGVDAVLMAGLGPFKMINAAEIIRYSDAGWSEEDARQCEQMFKSVIYPVVKDFALFANGNWDTAAEKTMIAMGVFCNDRAMFERGLRYYVDGAGDGRLTHYIINEDGQCQESGRDQQHDQLGLAHLGDCSEIAWHQGLNLYTYADNRLLKGFEYTAKYNLGEDVPFTETLDRTGKYHHTVISTQSRGRLRAVYEQIYNHYVNRMGIPAPYTQRAAEKIRPEGSGSGADHTGFGTLLYSRPASVPTEATRPPASPGGLIAHGSDKQIVLTWIESIGAANYLVKRATASGGAYTTIADKLTSATYTDSQVETGKVYYYTVAAANARGGSPDAFETSACAGLPAPWAAEDMGAVVVPGRTNFDGKVYTLEGAGSDIGSAADQGQFAYVPWDGDAVMTVRFVPQVSSMLSKFGIMMRESTATDAANVALLFTPKAGERGGAERPDWAASLLNRVSGGSEEQVAGAVALADPYIVNGRFLEAGWLKLQRSGHTFAAFVSTDGQAWTPVGTTTTSLPDHLLIGLAACSRLSTVSTTVRFDNVSVVKPK